MATDINYLRLLPQTRGLTGRKYRTPVTEKYASRFSGLGSTPKRTSLKEAATLDGTPTRRSVNREAIDGEGIGSEASGFGYGSSFGGTISEEASLQAIDPGRFLGLPIARGAKTAALGVAAGLPPELVAQAVAMGIPFSAMAMAPRALMTGYKHGKMSENIDQVTGNLSADQKEATIRGAMLAQSQAKEKGPLNPSNPNYPQPPVEMLKVFNLMHGAAPGETGGYMGETAMGSEGPPGRGDTSGMGFDLGLGEAAIGGFDGGSEGAPGRGDTSGFGEVDGDGEGAGGGSATVLCTSLYEQGIMPRSIYLSDVAYAGRLSDNIIKGYRLWAAPIARLMKRSRFVTDIVKGPVMAWANHMAFYGSGAKVGKPTLVGRVAEYIGCPICELIGKFVRS